MQVAVFPPSTVVAVITAEPYPVAVSFPFSAATTEAFELSHKTLVSVAFAGVIVAVRISVSSTCSEISDLFSEMPLTCTVFGFHLQYTFKSLESGASNSEFAVKGVCQVSLSQYQPSKS